MDAADAGQTIGQRSGNPSIRLRTAMSEYHQIKRQAFLKTLLVASAALYAIGCAVTTTLSLASL